MISRGLFALTDRELLALILGRGGKGVGVLGLARRVYHCFDEKGHPSFEDFTAIDGVGPAKACPMAAVLEYSRRRLMKKNRVIRNAEDIYPLVAHMAEKNRTFFLSVPVRCQRSDRHPDHHHWSFELQSVHRRHFRPGRLGDFRPQPPSCVKDPGCDDVLVTDRLCKAGERGGEVLDPVIVAGREMFSFKENGMLSRVV